MSQFSEYVLERLKNCYSAYYNITGVLDIPDLRFRCDYHSRDSQYVLVKSAELWAAESHEYLYLWDVEHLDCTAAERIFRTTLEDGEPRIKPHSQHMSTYLTAIVLYQSAAPDGLERLRKLKKRREFKLSLHGWMEFRIAAVDLSTGKITVNRAGKTLEKDLTRMMERIIECYKGEEKKQ